MNKKNIEDNKSNNNELSEEEINSLLNTITEEMNKIEAEFSKVREYKDNCQYFKNKECSGEQSYHFNNNSGCKVCMENNEYNNKNALPAFGTKEYDKFSKDVYNVTRDLHKNCQLAIDEKHCRYKYSFQFCVYCNRTFQKER